MSLSLSNTLHLSLRAPRRVLLLTAIALLTIGVAGGCAGKKDPHAELRAKTSAQASALRAESSKLEQKAREMDLKAEQDRVVAKALLKDGRTIVLAGEARIEQFDHKRGQSLVDRGQSKIDRANEQLRKADEMNEEADAMRDHAASLDRRAAGMMASLPKE